MKVSNCLKIIICLFFLQYCNTSTAQKLIKKELKTEDDGYRWYRHYFKIGKDTLQAAFNLSGERLTPISERVYYYTFKDKRASLPKIFECWEFKTPIGINSKGEMQYTEVMSLYNRQGLCIIPADAEFNGFLINDYDGEWLIHGNKYRYIDGKQNSYDEKTFSIDGRYYVETYVYSIAEFHKNKKPAPFSNVNNANANQNTATTPSTQKQQHPQPQPDRQPQPMQVWVQCSGCHGSGQCQCCGGLGWKYMSSSHPQEQCICCGGMKKCNICAGNGGHNEIQYR